MFFEQAVSEQAADGSTAAFVERALEAEFLLENVSTRHLRLQID